MIQLLSKTTIINKSYMVYYISRRNTSKKVVYYLVASQRITRTTHWAQCTLALHHVHQDLFNLQNHKMENKIGRCEVGKIE